ncbi:MAG: hypothetical protein PHU94_05655, partial [Bacilli bacterium]|nr:hypothetical protein [Bacilli bacterium]
MRSKGFTLIQLIGVILITALVSFVTTSIFVTVIQKAKKEAFISNIDNLVDSFDLLIRKEESFGNEIDNIDINNDKLKDDKNNFISGHLKYNDQKQIEVSYVSDGAYCLNGVKDNYEIKNGNCAYLDETPPVINSIGVIFDDVSIKIIIDAKDIESGILKYEYSLDNEKWIETDSNFTIDNLESGVEYTIYIRITNYNGQVITKTIKRITSSIPYAKLDIEPEEWSKEKNVTITFPEGNYTYQYLRENDKWVTSKERIVEFRINKKTYITTKVINKNGKEAILTYNIEKIDNDIPTCKIEIENKDVWEKEKILKITGSDDGQIYGIVLPNEAEYSLNDKVFYRVFENGIYTALVKDMFGNTNTCSTKVETVDSTAPTNVTAAVIGRTQNSLTVETSALDLESGILKYEYSIDGNEFVLGKNKHEFKNITNEKSNIKVRVTNNALLSTTFEFETIENEKPNFLINESGWSTEKIVTITFPEKKEGYVYQYNKNGSEWINVEGTITQLKFNENGYVVAKITKNGQLTSTTSFNVNNIDTTAPTNVKAEVTAKTKNTITVTASGIDLESGILKYEFKIDDGHYISSKNNVYTFEGVTERVHKINVKVINRAGLEQEALEITSTPDIDLNPKVVITPNEWSKEKTVTITFVEGFKNEYRINDGKWINVNNKVVLTLKENGFVSTRVSDGNTILNNLTVDINKIDNTLPTCNFEVENKDIWTTEKNIKIQANDADSGIYGVILPTEEEYTTGSSFNYKALENKTYSITVKDNAGLTRKCFIDITKID